MRSENRLEFVTATLIGCSLLSSCAKTTETSPPEVAALATPAGETVVTFGDRAVGAAELREKFLALPDRTRRRMDTDGQRKFVENLAVQELLLAEGRERGFDRDPDIRRQVRDYERRLVAQKVINEVRKHNPISDAEVAEYYQANLRRYSTATVRARHILLKDAVEAAAIQAQAVAAPDSFPDLAREHSADVPSAAKGGDLGFFGHGRMAPAFEEAAFRLEQPLAVSEVVETPFGFHVIQMVERRPGKTRSLEEVREQIRSMLGRRAMEQRLRDFHAELRQRADISIDEEALARVVDALPEPSPGAHGAMFGH